MSSIMRKDYASLVNIVFSRFLSDSFPFSRLYLVVEFTSKAKLGDRGDCPNTRTDCKTFRR